MVEKSIPQSPQLVKFFSEMVNKSINNISITPQDVKMLLSIPMGSAWMKSHPHFLQAVPEAKDLFAGKPPNTIKQQNKISQDGMATNWTGVCDELTKVSSPTLIITGTDDNNVPSAIFNYCRKNPRSLACADSGCRSCIIRAISR
jgi:hypothetical protein